MSLQPRSGPDTELLERVLGALADGVPAEAQALAGHLRVGQEDASQALAAVQAYQEAIGLERPRGRSEAGIHDSAMLPRGTRLGDYMVDDLLGRGAMGVVYRARQVSLGERPVALKVLPASLVAKDQRFADRFRREATLAAAIHHPNLAEVYDICADGDAICFAMRLVEGRTLQDVLLGLSRRHPGADRTTPTSHVRSSVQLCRAVADALAEVHAHGLVHRDVKPANVLLEHAGADDQEALAARPVLVDFGLLRPAGDTDLTGTRTLLGTPAYASPETQLGRELDARADVYSLGAMLHDLLTVTPAMQRRPATAGLPDVRAVNGAVDARLAAIVRMALQERRELRYEHGGALRDELDCYLRGEPIRALPSRAFGRFRLWYRQDPVRAIRRVAVLGTGLLVVLVATAWILVWSVGLTRLASGGAACEDRGDLLGAADCYRALVAAPGANLLFGMQDELDHAAAYRPRSGALAEALRLMQDAQASLKDDQPVDAAQRLLVTAGNKLCEPLYDDGQKQLHAPIQHYLMAESRRGQPEVRQRAAFDTWSNYLLVVDGRQTYPAGLPELLRDKLLGEEAPELAKATRLAALAAYGTLRQLVVFADLVQLMRDRDPEMAMLATNCSYHVYRWIHKDQPEVYAQISPKLLEDWAAASEEFDSRGNGHVVQTVAEHLGYWEWSRSNRPEPERTLRLSASMRAIVDQKRLDREAKWAQAEAAPQLAAEDLLVTIGLRATTYDDRLWKNSPAQDQEVELGRRDPKDCADPGVPSTIRFERDERQGKDLAILTGTVFAASAMAAEVGSEGDPNNTRLEFHRPGRSQLRFRTVVPEGAENLVIRIIQFKAIRLPLRDGGSVEVELSMPGKPWSCLTSAPSAGMARIPGSKNIDCDTFTTATVSAHLLLNEQELEFVLKEVRGNTRHWVKSVELFWTLAPR